MGYNEDFNLFNERKEKEASGLSGEQLIAWYISNEPFGLYFATKELWKRKDQRSKDEALNYYEEFVKHPDIKEEHSEVKDAIKTVLKAYRTGYGTRKEQLDAAQAFEQRIIEKGFNVPKGKKISTEADRYESEKRMDKFNIGMQIVNSLAGIVLIFKGIKKAIDFFRKE